MMGLLRRQRQDVPGDPSAAILTRMVSSSAPITSAWWMPGAWVGNGLYLEGLQVGDVVDEDRLEALVTGSGGAFDVVIVEPIELIRQLLVTGRDRDELWFATMLEAAGRVLPTVLPELLAGEGEPPSLEHAKLVGAVFMHPISCCWPVEGDRYHAHCIFPGRIYCDDPSCAEH